MKNPVQFFVSVSIVGVCALVFANLGTLLTFLIRFFVDDRLFAARDAGRVDLLLETAQRIISLAYVWLIVWTLIGVGFRVFILQKGGFLT